MCVGGGGGGGGGFSYSFTVKSIIINEKFKIIVNAGDGIQQIHPPPLLGLWLHFDDNTTMLKHLVCPAPCYFDLAFLLISTS